MSVSYLGMKDACGGSQKYTVKVTLGLMRILQKVHEGMELKGKLILAPRNLKFLCMIFFFLGHKPPYMPDLLRMIQWRGRQ